MEAEKGCKERLFPPARAPEAARRLPESRRGPTTCARRGPARQGSGWRWRGPSARRVRADTLRPSVSSASTPRRPQPCPPLAGPGVLQPTGSRAEKQRVRSPHPSPLRQRRRRRFIDLQRRRGARDPPKARRAEMGWERPRAGTRTETGITASGRGSQRPGEGGRERERSPRNRGDLEADSEAHKQQGTETQRRGEGRRGRRAELGDWEATVGKTTGHSVGPQQIFAE